MQRRHHLNVAREVALLSQLRALRVPHIVTLLAATECGANVYLTFPVAEGGDLYVRIRDGSARAAGEARLCREVRFTGARARLRMQPPHAPAWRRMGPHGSPPRRAVARMARMACVGQRGARAPPA